MPVFAGSGRAVTLPLARGRGSFVGVGGSGVAVGGIGVAAAVIVGVTVGVMVAAAVGVLVIVGVTGVGSAVSYFIPPPIAAINNRTMKNMSVVGNTLITGTPCAWSAGVEGAVAQSTRPFDWVGIFRFLAANQALHFIWRLVFAGVRVLPNSG